MTLAGAATTRVYVRGHGQAATPPLVLLISTAYPGKRREPQQALTAPAVRAARPGLRADARTSHDDEVRHV